jgi:hypothetical protein
MSHGGAVGVMANDTPGTSIMAARARLVRIIDKCFMKKNGYGVILIFCSHSIKR